MESAEPRILLVEDDPDLNDSLCVLISGSGMKVTNCFDGTVAVELLKRERFDLVLSDIHMPVLSGLNLLLDMRARGDMTSVMFLTGCGDRESAMAALRLGAIDFVEKPIKIEVLLERLHRALDISRREREEPIDDELNRRLVGLLRAKNLR